MLELSPVDDYAHYALGRCLEKQGRAHEANGHYKLASLAASRRSALRGADQGPRVALEPAGDTLSLGMRAVVQRVSRARSTPGGEIGAGLVVLLGVAQERRRSGGRPSRGQDRAAADLRRRGRQFDRSLLDAGGAALVVSQFTLIADTGEGEPAVSPARAARGCRAALRALLRGAPRARRARRERRLRRADGGRARERRPVTIVLDS